VSAIVVFSLVNCVSGVLRRFGVSLGLVLGDYPVHDSEADLHPASDGPKTFIFGTAGEDRAALVFVDDETAPRSARSYEHLWQPGRITSSARHNVSC